MPELELSQVERQIFLAHMMEIPHHATLEQAPERFDIVRVNLAAYIFALAMTDCFVWIDGLQPAVTGMLIRRYQVNLIADRFVYKAIQRRSIGTLNNLTDDIAFPANRTNHSDLTATLAAAHVGFLIPVPVFVLAPTNVSSTSTMPMSF